jgi:O-antigen ligase
MGLSFRLIFYEYINIVLFFYIFYKVVNSVKKVNDVLLLGCLGNGLYSAFSVFTGTFREGRLCFGGMFDPNDLAFITLSFLPFNLIFISRNNPLWVRCVCLGSFGVGTLLILLTGSRGGLLAFGAVALMLMFMKTIAIKSAMKIVFALLCLVFFAFAPINLTRYQTILHLTNDYNLSEEGGRIAIWSIGVKTMLANPLTGVGVGCYSQAVGMDRLRRGLLRANWQTAHNSVIQIGAETGVIGLTLFLLMSINVFRIFNRTRKKSMYPIDLIKIGEMGMVGFVGLVVSGLFLSQAYSTCWVFYIALSAVLNQFSVRYKD